MTTKHRRTGLPNGRKTWCRSCGKQAAATVEGICAKCRKAAK